jgi:hypothetical protein
MPSSGLTVVRSDAVFTQEMFVAQRLLNRAGFRGPPARKRFDRKHAARMICNADVAEGQVDQAVLGQQVVGCVALRLNLAITTHRKSMRFIAGRTLLQVPQARRQVIERPRPQERNLLAT